MALLFKVTIHTHIQNAQTNCEGSHSVRLSYKKISLNPFATGDAYMRQLFHCLQ